MNSANAASVVIAMSVRIATTKVISLPLSLAYPANIIGLLKMKPKFPIGTRVGKKKPSASLKLPNKRGVIVDYVQKANRSGAVRTLYVVEPDHSPHREEWDPSVVYLLEGNEGVNNIAFV